MRFTMDSFILAGVVVAVIVLLIVLTLEITNSFQTNEKAQSIVFAHTVISAANSLCEADEGSFVKTLPEPVTIKVYKQEGKYTLRVIYGEKEDEFYESDFLCEVAQGGPKSIKTIFVKKEPGEIVYINDFSGGLTEGESCSPDTKKEDFLSAIEKAETEYSLVGDDEMDDLIKSIIMKTSGFIHCENGKLIKRSNGVGAMMLTDSIILYVVDSGESVDDDDPMKMKGVYEDCEISGFDPENIEHNIQAGVCYLNFIRKNFFSESEDWVRMVAASYRCGPVSIKKLVDDYVAENNDAEFNKVMLSQVTLKSGDTDCTDAGVFAEGVYNYYKDCCNPDVGGGGTDCIC